MQMSAFDHVLLSHIDTNSSEISYCKPIVLKFLSVKHYHKTKLTYCYVMFTVNVVSVLCHCINCYVAMPSSLPPPPLDTQCRHSFDFSFMKYD